ncbi:MAG: hypothetical protein KBB39_12190 [Phycicoccus sp.]|nr:hypothetical protein [Phycicoccus sp.]
MSLPLPESELRGLIREVLRELVRDEVARALADLRPAAGAARSAPTRAPARAATLRQSPRGGVVTERTVDAAGRAGDTVIVLGRGAVATPLAKDRARRLGIRIEKDNEEN